MTVSERHAIPPGRPGNRFAGRAHIVMPVTIPAELAKAGSVGARATPAPFWPSGPIADQP